MSGSNVPRISGLYVGGFLYPTSVVVQMANSWVMGYSSANGDLQKTLWFLGTTGSFRGVSGLVFTHNTRIHDLKHTAHILKRLRKDIHLFLKKLLTRVPYSLDAYD